MNDNIKKQIKSAMSKRLREEKEFIFEGIDSQDSKTLEKFFEENDIEDYIWEEDLEESLYDETDVQGDQVKEYQVGDIIMTQRFKSKGSYHESPHRILIITSKKDSGGEMRYEGFLLSSKVDKSNKYGHYPNNIYIKDYSTILYRGKSSSKEAFLRVDDIVSFTSKDLDISGSWKGKASYDFMRFVQNCYSNYKRGIDNSTIYWE